MTRRGNASTWGALCMLVVALTGCGGSAAVEGTVTFNGQPLEKGGISFIAKDGGATPLTVGEDIAGGKYSIAADRGLKPGEYRVEVYGSTESAAPASADPDMQSSSSNSLPEKFNTESQLSADLKSGPNSLKFDLKP